MPGTTSKGRPAASSASASSPPRPKTNGSPPLRRTTARPSRAWVTSRVWLSSRRTDPPRPRARAPAPPAEDERISPLEAHHRAAQPGLGDEQGVDVLLPHRLAAAL